MTVTIPDNCLACKSEVRQHTTRPVEMLYLCGTLIRIVEQGIYVDRSQLCIAKSATVEGIRLRWDKWVEFNMKAKRAGA